MLSLVHNKGEKNKILMKNCEYNKLVNCPQNLYQNIFITELFKHNDFKTTCVYENIIKLLH